MIGLYFLVFIVIYLDNCWYNHCMKSIYLDTLLLLSDSLHGRKSTHINADNWTEVFRELQVHTVASLIAPNVAHIDLSSDDKIRFMQILGLSFRNYNNVFIEQKKVLDYLREAGVDVAVLKGTSAAKYYPNPEYRAMGDIDLLVRPDNFYKAHSVIKSLNYVSDLDKNERHIGFHNGQGLEIELHRYFSSVGTKEQRQYFDNRLYDALSNSVNGDLPEVECGLILIGHIAQHLRSGLGLRQIIDWMMYAETNLNDTFWNEAFSITAEKCGFKKLAKVSTAACRKYLGLNIDITWCDDVEDSLIDSFMNYIMCQGNFGRKINNGDRTFTTFVNNLRSPAALFKYLQSNGKVHWKLARTNKFIGFFAWIYQIGYIVRMGLTRKVSIKNLKSINDESKKIVKLMDELEIKEY